MPPVLAIVTELPTPYRAPLYDLLAARGAVTPHVLYLVAREVLRSSWAVALDGHRHEHLHGGSLTVRGPRGPFAWKWTRGVGRRLDALRPDAVLVSGWAHGAMHAASRWAARRGVPSLVVSESHLRPGRGALRAWARDRVARPLVARAAAWLPVSSRAQALLVHLGADPARCFVVPNAPDAARFARAREDLPRRAAVRAELGAGDEPVTVFVGRLIPAKAVEGLLDAAATLRPVPRTWVVGGGPRAAALVARAAARGLGDRVRFLPPQPYPRVVELLAAADVVALPSVHEPYGVALHEGMAAGCVALASDAVGAAADLVDAATGTTFPAGDVAALARAWDGLLADPAARRARAAAAQARALERGLPFAAAQVERGVEAALRAGPAGARVVPSRP